MKTMPMILKQIPNIQIPYLPPLNLGQQEALPAPLTWGHRGLLQMPMDMSSVVT